METLKLACVLSAEEKDMKAQELVRELNSQLQLKEEKKDLVKDFVEQIKLSERRAAKIARDVQTGTEEREVPIERRKLFEQNMIEVWRLDTNELVSRRAMDAAERQREMFEGEEGEGEIDPDAPPNDDALAEAEEAVAAAFPDRAKKRKRETLGEEAASTH